MVKDDYYLSLSLRRLNTTGRQKQPKTNTTEEMRNKLNSK